MCCANPLADNNRTVLDAFGVVRATFGRSLCHQLLVKSLQAYADLYLIRNHLYYFDVSVRYACVLLQITEHAFVSASTADKTTKK